MNDKAAKKLAEGELARKGRALQSIKEILGLTDETYQAWLDSMTEHERATHDAEVERYMVRVRFIKFQGVLGGHTNLVHNC